MTANGRKISTLKNLLYAWASQFITLGMSMFVRIVFVRILSKEYLGLSGLFSNIITILSLAELGLGGAIVYSLYEPLARDDKEQICALMRLYKTVYSVIGLLIGALGVALTPFLHWFIKDMPNIHDIRFIYILFVLNSAMSYFFFYKSSLISADQKEYILKKIQTVVLLLMYAVQIITLLVSRDYIFYLVIQILFTIILNIGYSITAVKLYPYLNTRNAGKLNQDTLDKIIQNTKGLVFHKIGGAIVTSTDSIIISKFIGLLNLGMYSNYRLIQDSLDKVLTQLYLSMSASVGNLVAVEGEEKSHQIFNKIIFLNFWIYGICSICFYMLAEDFIVLCFGFEYLLPVKVLFITVINFYLTGMRKAVIVFRNAYGLFWYNRYVPLAEACINLLFSLILVKLWGISGVLLGTTISMLVIPIWLEPYIIFKHGFHRKPIRFWAEYVQYLSITILTGMATWFVNKVCFYFIPSNFIIKILICFIVPNLVFAAFMRKNESFCYYLSLLNKKSLKGLFG